MQDNTQNPPAPPDHRPIEVCPYCKGTQIVKSGRRDKKFEQVQVYYCKHCDKKFTPLVTVGKTYPVAVILKAMTLYNRFESMEEVARRINEEYGFKVAANTVGNWVEDYKDNLPFLRMRDFLMPKIRGKELKTSDCIVENQFFHGQIYDFKYHRAKMGCILNEDFKHYKFRPLRDFLELVIAECPHQVFKDSEKRASEYRDVFHLEQVKITPKTNTATRNARFVMQAVANNKLRHQTLQEFMLVNDSVTVATEVPVLLDQDDVLHFRNSPNFNVPLPLSEGQVVTGHIPEAVSFQMRVV